MKNLTLFLIIFLTSLCLFSQTNDYYYLEIKSGYELGNVQTTTKTDQTLNFSMTNESFASVLNTKPIYLFKKLYPTSVTPRLQRVYLIEISKNISINDILQREEVEKLFLIEDTENVLFNNIEESSIILPNDYEDLITGGNNASLDLIKAPLAWTITSGNPNILVGVADTNVNLGHEDLDGQIVDNIIINQNSVSHGIGVSGAILAKTNNNKGISSLAHNTKLVFATAYDDNVYALQIGSLINGLLQLSQYPGVRVINCSWGISAGNSFKEDLDEVITEVEANGVLVVSSAGNSGTSYKYPASYDSTISVTGVGQRFSIGTPASNDGIPGNTNSWIDVHRHFPSDPNNTTSHNHNDKVDVTSPAIYVLMLTDNFEIYPSGYRLGIGTSIAAPFVTALAALVFSVNPSLTPSEVKDIIRNKADDIYYISYNQPYIGLLGTGRINAYRAVLKAQCMLSPSSGIDLAMQNSDIDSFEEPDTQTQYPWQSDDIWVRNQDDGVLIKENQNPEYAPNNPNYVYVKVTNNSCEATTGNDNLKLYWAKANTALSWPEHWDGTLFINDPVTGEDILMGDEIATKTIPPLEVGQEAIIEFEWNIPNPEDYENINPNPWHFCLLARIDTPNDPMTFVEGEAITQNVLNNNNIAWKNTTVVDIIPDDTPSPIGGVVAVGNYFSQQKTFTLELVKENDELGKSIYEEAEVTIEMDDILYNAWQEGGKNEQNTDSTRIVNKRIVTGNNALFENIILEPNEIGTLYLTFNFLTKELTNKTEFIYHLIQRDAVTNEIIGGETFEIRKKPRDSFIANAGNDEEIDKNETITISAGQITEDAVYNWYDPEGNLIYTGTDLTVSPDVTKKYKLEIISNIDGFKDYDEVEITVNPYKLESLIPNPASNLVTLNYMIDGAISAYVMVINMNTGNSDNYILDIQQSSTSIDVSTYTTGLYNIILVCDGEAQNSKILIKQ